MTVTDDICIDIEGVSCPILCGTCNAKIAFIGESNSETAYAGCAACENTGTVQEVADLAVQYAKDEGQLAFNRMARDAASKSSIMTFSGKTQHDKAYRFTVEFEL